MTASDVKFCLFIGGLSWSTDDKSLQNAFSSFDDVLESKVINDRETERSRGFGFVTFYNEQAMQDAIEGMNWQNLDGRNITVNRAQTRSGGGGGNGGGGGGYCGGGGGGYGGGRSEGGFGGGRSDGGYSHGGGGGGGGGGRDRGYDGESRYSRGGGGSDGTGEIKGTSNSISFL